LADLTRVQSDLPINIAGVNPSTGVGTFFANVDTNGNLFVLPTNAGPVAAGTVAANSGLIGGQYNSTLPTLTTGQQAAVQVDASGRIIIAPTTQGLLAEDHNYGTVGANTLRTASQIGNATGAADFNAGATGAQTLRVSANLAVGGANVTSTNPVPVTFSNTPIGNVVNNYNTVAAVAANGTSNHIYTITTGKTFQGKKVWGSASGLLKIEVRVSPDGSTYSTLWVGFNSTVDPNITIDMDEMVFLESGAGSTVEVIRTNLSNKAQDVYSTISGTEV